MTHYAKPESNRVQTSGKLITFTHHKGGTGKTTACVNIAGWLTKMKQKVLLIDLDPQANATSGLGVNVNSIEKSMYDVLLSEVNLEDIILETEAGVYLAPASMQLLRAESEILPSPDAFNILASKVHPIQHLFDYILIDSPPGSNVLMINSLVAAKNIIIPLDTGIFSYETLDILNCLIYELENELKISINILMTIFKKYSASLFDFRISKIFYNHVNDYFFVKHKKSYSNFVIPFSNKVYYSQMLGLPISHYAPRSAISRAYQKIAKNIMATDFI